MGILATMTDWHYTATWPRPADVTDEQREALIDALPGFAIVHDDGERWITADGTLAETVADADWDISDAAKAAANAAGRAHGRAFGVYADPIKLRVLPEADYQAEIEAAARAA